MKMLASVRGNNWFKWKSFKFFFYVVWCIRLSRIGWCCRLHQLFLPILFSQISHLFSLYFSKAFYSPFPSNFKLSTSINIFLGWFCRHLPILFSNLTHFSHLVSPYLSCNIFFYFSLKKFHLSTYIKLFYSCGMLLSSSVISTYPILFPKLTKICLSVFTLFF